MLSVSVLKYDNESGCENKIKFTTFASNYSNHAQMHYNSHYFVDKRNDDLEIHVNGIGSG